jgi:4-amino-4-deoxy-L-arabinose transferase-like glycosyltransferase
MRLLRSIPPALWLILAVAFVVRMLGAWFGNLMYDERAHLALAQTIDLRPGHLHLVFRTLDHPLLSIYILKLSSLLFGQSDFGLRILHVLFGTATVVPVYLLGRELRSVSAGLWAAAFLAVDQFHVSWSRMFMPEVVMLFFWSLALLQMLRVVRTQSAAGFVLLGVWLGMAYLAKETGILLLPVIWSFLLSTPEHRRLLWNPKWYLAHGVFLLTIAPDVLWNLMHFSESYLHRDAQMLSEEFRLQWKSVSLYLGELIRALIDENALDTDYLQGNAFACHWPAGLLYLTSVAAMLRPPIPAPRRLLVLGFAIVFLFFTFLPGGNRFEPFWWASASLISAVVLTGTLIERAALQSRAVRWACLLLLLYLAGHVAVLMTRPGGPEGRGYPRATVEELAAESLEAARFAVAEGDLRTPHFHLIYALNIGGADADVYAYLGYLHLLQQEHAAAKKALVRALVLQPDHSAARALLESIRRHRSRSETIPRR